jgi:hypothetical protein
MNTDVRIRENLEMTKLYEWPNPPAPAPLKQTRAQACVEANKKLEADRRRWALRAIFNGL